MLTAVPRYIPWALLDCGHLASPMYAASRCASLPCPHCGTEWISHGGLAYRRRWVVAQRAWGPITSGGNL